MAQIAGRQHGLVTAAQLRACGVAASTITRRARDGRLHRIHRGVYSVGHASLSQEGRWLSAVLAIEGALLSHVAASRLLGIWRRGSDSEVHVVSPHSRPGLPGVAVHRSRTLLARDATVCRGIPVTSAARTMLDLGDVLTRHQLAHVLHTAAFRRLLDHSELEDVIRRNPGRRARGVLLGALQLRRSRSRGTRSFAEDSYLAEMLRVGLPEPAVNTPIRTGGGMVEPDFFWEGQRLCVEVDGGQHEDEVNKAADRDRDAWLVRDGVHVVRFPETRRHGIQRNVARVRQLLASRS